MPGRHPSRVIVCETVEEYVRVCRDRARRPHDVPLLNRSEKWLDLPTARRFLPGEMVSFETYLAEIRPDLPTYEAASSERKFLCQLAPDCREESHVTVITSDGVSAYAAVVLSLALQERLRVVDADSLLSTARELMVRGPVVIVLPLEQADDRLLSGLLAEFEGALATDCEWHRLPQYSIVTARDLPALSWLVTKIILAQTHQTALQDELRMASFNGFPEQGVITEFRRNGDQCVFDRRGASAFEIVDALVRPSAVVAHMGHGRDACSNTGSGVWFCGRREHATPLPEAGHAILSCGLGQPCLQGPHPVQLSRVSSDMIFLASCNSLRLATSSLHRDFNLGLEFLEGAGRAYVGATRFQSSGVAVRAFLASVASGMTLSQATNIANASVKIARFDGCTFVSVGHAEDSVVCDSTDRSECITLGIDQEIAVSGPKNNMRCVLLSHAHVVQAAKSSNLALRVSAPLQGDSPSWLYRLEVQESEASAPREVVRIFIFRFPEPIEDLKFELLNRDSIERGLQASLTTLETWAETLEQAGVPRQPGTILYEIESSLRMGSRSASQLIFSLGYDGGAVAGIERRQQANRELASKAAIESMRTLMPLLSQGWYLANTLGDAYPFHASAPATCPYCDSGAVEWIGKSPTHSAERGMIVCPRCGTVADLPRGGPYASIDIRISDEARAGDSIAGSILVKLSEGVDIGRAIHVSTRVDTPGLPGLTPWRETRTQEVRGPVVEFPFCFSLPLEFAPRQCGVRVLLTGREGVAFAQRLLFVY